MSIEQFGEMPDGAIVERVTIEGGGLQAKILSFGGVVQDLRMAGYDKALVLGFDSFPSYLTQSPYFGATAGRYANRIRDGRFDLDGKTHQLDINYLGKHTLHGGKEGISERLWHISAVTPSSVTMTLALDDGEMGFPGNMTIELTYDLLEAGVFDIKMSAIADATTLCNLAHHSYFNLDGSPTIEDHHLQIMAEQYLELDDEQIPTGTLLDVAKTPLDFREPKAIRDALTQTSIDNNFCVEEGAGSLRKIAVLSSPSSGISMEVLSTEPGVQAYDGSYIDIQDPGLDGMTFKAMSGFCLEPQIWPDSIHHPHFPQAILKPGETYSQHTQYVFSKS